MSTLPSMHPDQALAIRRRIGMTQEQMAAKLGVDLRTLQRWERGDRSIPGPAVLLLRRLLEDHGYVISKSGEFIIDT